LFPFLVIVPGLVAAALAVKLPAAECGAAVCPPNYDYTLPLLLKQFYPTGMLGLGLAALLASFMSGMAGNVTAFNTVWTFDIFQAYLKKDATDAQLLAMGKHATFFGVVISIAAAYLCQQFNSLMDYMQLLFGFFNAPIFATFLLGMFWKRATPHGAFFGLLSGIIAGVAHHVARGQGLVHYTSDMAAAFYGAIVSFSTCTLVTTTVSFATKPRDEKELVGLVYSLTPKPRNELRWYKRPTFAATIVIVVVIVLNIRFW
jgi:solute:Na+ symporter, SSS family